jgi:penicillin amidase
MAWGVTNFGPDVQDLYVEQFEGSGRRYKVGDGWRDAEVRTEHIVVRREGLEPAYDVRDVDVLVTRHGPVVRDEGARKFALRWTALDPVCEMSAFLSLDAAKNWDDFRSALATYPGPAQNFVYADVDGHVGYYAAGNIPIRRTGTGDAPYDGAGDAGDWLGYVPFDRLPHVLDPPDGFVVTANNRTVGTSVSEFYTHEWIAPFRAYRIEELLKAAERLTPASMNDIQNDAYSYPDAIFAREVVSIARDRARAGAAGSSEWDELADRLGGWDGRLTVDSVPAAVVVTMRKKLFDRVLAGKLGDRAASYSWFGRETLYTNLIEQRPERWLPPGTASWDTLLLDAYGEAKHALTEKLGADPAGWRYGHLNTFTLAHPLARVPGLATVVNLAPFEIDGGQSAIKAVGVLRGWGPSMRLVVDVGDFDRSTLVLPAGESGQPASPHYADQTDDWRDGRTFPFPYSESAVAAATVETLVLVPAP